VRPAAPAHRRAAAGRRVLILVENLPVPFDRRVWQEACALRDAGHEVSVVCPTGPGHERRFETIDRIDIHRYRLPVEARGAAGYALEYAAALLCSFVLAWRVHLGRGFDVIHACNPPDLFFLIGGFFKLLGKRYLFDQHDLCPELYVAKFGRRDAYHRLLLALERLNFRVADVSIATNQSYRRVAIERGGKPPSAVFVVRSGPSLDRMRIQPADATLKRGRRFLVGYVGVMGHQEGIDTLLRAVHHIVYDLRRTDIHFGLVGGGTSLEEMRQLAGRLGIDDYVTFTGRVADEVMLGMLNSADVCVNPDRANELNDASTMNKIMEYMALGKPIVQFDLREGRHSAQRASLYARRDDFRDFAAKIVELVDDAPRREEMGRLGRWRVETELEWSHEVPKLLAAYDALWREPAARRHEASAS
jgi:glycosyltransferase involved in cell wall biosynthesis